jgi:RNA polymerase sigma-54 factor
MRGPSQRLELRQSQKLIIAPQLKQAIKMLQRSNLELTDIIDREARENPLLEWRGPKLGGSVVGNHFVGGERASPAAVSEALAGELTSDVAEDWQPEQGERGDRPVDFGGEPQPWQGRNGAFDREGRPRLDQTATRSHTLREHMLEQIGADLVHQGDRVIAVHLLDQLDEAGYLRADLDSGAPSGLQYGTGRACFSAPPAIRSCRCLCSRPEGMPGSPAT